MDRVSVLEQVGASPQGLSQEEAARRLEQYGPNQLEERGLHSPLAIFLGQFKEIMVLILVVAGAISLIVGKTTDAMVIMMIVLLNATMGFIQEYRAERAMAALKKLAVPIVRVRRAGQVREVEATSLVPGDVILLEAGDRVPADARVIESVNLRVEEAALTGESVPVDKIETAIGEDNIPLGDRRNMLFMGTAVAYGRGAGVVVQTGMRTELGNIADMLQQVTEEKTPLQRRIVQLGKWLALGAIGLVVLAFLLGLWRGEPLRELFLTAISLAVAAVPEGLPTVVIVALALGAQRMVRQRALIRKLPAVETLGSVTTICSDKTGTLTENRMAVIVLDVAGSTVNLSETLRRTDPLLSKDEGPLATPSPDLALLLAGGALANDAILQPRGDGTDGYQAVGDPTEGALVVAAARLGLWKTQLEELLPRVAEVPFTSERKRMTTVHRLAERAAGRDGDAPRYLSGLPPGSNYLVFTKGAVDSLLQVCDRVWNQGTIEVLDAGWRARIEGANDALAQQGMRVLGVATRSLVALPEAADEDHLETGQVFVGLAGMIDPPRPEAKGAVAKCRTAGIRPVMITGDHPLTALNIATDLGIAQESNGLRTVITGQQLAEMSVAELEKVVDQVSVYARVSPEHKVKIVEALKARGQIVAMTGDGVNDAPALKRADIGVAMGIMGTDVSKEAAEMVLLDDNFATIVRAVEEGRTIYENIRKFVRYTFSSNIGEIVAVLLAPILALPIPLTALQILWINLMTDGVPGLALGVEPSSPDTMERPPRPPTESVLARGVGTYMGLVGVLMGVVALLPQLLAAWGVLPLEEEIWRTMVFNTLCLAQMGNALAVRSDRFTVAQLGLLSNKPMILAVVVTFLLQLALIYVPFLQGIFRTKPLTASQFAISLGLSTIVLITVETVKWARQRRRA
jgi:Ca2+-transporting ATPase